MRTRSTLAVAAAVLAALPVALAAFPAHAKDPAGAAFEYRDGDTVCEGWLAKPAGVQGKRPAVLLFHDWMGVGDLVKGQAEMLAGKGYVALAADVYGKGVRPKDMGEAGQNAGKWKGDRTGLRRRVVAAFDALAKDPNVDAAAIGAIGFCFGGMAALELGRAGAPVAAIVTFHGSLDTPTPADGKNVKAKVLVLHGADDPHVKQTDVSAFMDEMRTGGVDWQLVQYGGAVHAFTNPAAHSPEMGAVYDERASRRAWRAMDDFFEETLRPKGK